MSSEALVSLRELIGSFAYLDTLDLLYRLLLEN
jgi:hypothetical protein